MERKQLQLLAFDGNIDILAMYTHLHKSMEEMDMMKRIVSMVLSLALVLSCLPLAAWAEEVETDVTAEAVTEPVETTAPAVETTAPETEPAVPETEPTVPETEPQTVTVTNTTVSAVELAESSQLETAYLENLLYGSGVSTYGIAARERLNDLGKQLYDVLKDHIEAVAVGEKASSVFVLSDTVVDGWGAQRTFAAADANAAFVACLDQFDIDAVIDALLHDCPCELYWYDKVTGVWETATCYYGDAFTISQITFSFQVVGDYQPSGYDANSPTVDASGAEAAAAAAVQAKSIVAGAAGKSDYEKLRSYKEQICLLVDYDYDSAQYGSFSAESGPWQLIHVFDGDANTKVVCEGYSKAFQYLCDLSAFSGDTACYTVSGQMTGGTGAGSHMWNIVTIGGQNYLVDITNSEYGTAGGDGSLFLAGTPGSIASGYDFGNVYFAYGDASVALWGTGTDSILKLASTDFDPNAVIEPEPTDPAEPENAASGTCGGDLTWTLDQNGTLTISGTGAMDDFGTVAQPWREHVSSITSVVVEAGVTSIGDFAFGDCTALTSVEIPNTVTSLGDEVFGDCKALTGIVLPDSIQQIGSYLFTSCANLASVQLPANITEIPDHTFWFCNKLTEVNIPAGVTKIGMSAFAQCHDLPSVNLPNGLTEIGQEAFVSCLAMTDIALPESVTIIDSGAFSSCTGLTSISIPAGVKEIKAWVFMGCENLQSVSLHDNITSIGQWAFYGCKKLPGIVIPKNVASIDMGAFYNCTALTEIVFTGNAPTFLTQIDETTYAEESDAFYGVTATAYYPADNTTWTADVLQDYGGTITWEPYSEVEEMTLEEFLAGVETAKASGKPFVMDKPLTLTEDLALSDVDIDFVGSASLNVAEGCTLTMDGDVNFGGDGTGGIWVMDGGVITIGSKARVTLENTLLLIDAGGKVNNLGAVRTTADAALAEYCGIYVAAEGGLDNHGTILVTGGTQLLSEGSVYNVGTITMKAGTLLGLIGETKNDGTIELEENSEYAIDGTFTGNTPIVTEAVDASGTCGSGVTWVYDTFSGTLTISGTGAMLDMDAGSGNAVPWKDYLNWIEKVVVEDGVTYIGAYAFMDCPNLTSVSIADSVSGIGTAAFQNAVSLTAIRLPEAITQLSDSLFSGCSALTTVNIPGKTTRIGYGVFSECPSLTKLEIPATVTKIGNGAFRGSGLTSVTVPDGVTKIAYGTFQNCKALTEVNLPAYIGSIEDYAFAGCSALTELAVPETVTSFGKYAFSDCTRLAGINVPDGVVSIGIGCFMKCSALTSIHIPVGITVIPTHAFAYTGLTDVVLPEGVYMVEGEAFYDCGSLRSISLPSTLTSFNGNGIFQLCSALESVTLPEGITKIPQSTFQFCSALKTVELPANLTAIHNNAFASCESLSTIVLPDSLTTLGQYAFAMCEALQEITLSTGLKKIDTSTFYMCKALKTITIPDSITSIGSEAFRCTGLTNVVIPDSVTEILDLAFHDCPSLTAVRLPASLTTIHYGLFMGSGLASIEIPASVTQVDDYAFAYCPDLTEVTFLGDAPAFADQVFFDVTANVSYPADNATWTASVKQQYSGTLTWADHGGETPELVLPFSENEWEVLKLVNQERAAENKAPLTGLAKLQEAADIRARELIKVFDHTRPDGTDCFTVLDQVGLTNLGATAENIASGQRSPASVMNTWMNSTGHRGNILDESGLGFAHIGVGEYTYNWVQLFTDGSRYTSIRVHVPEDLRIETGTTIEEMDLAAVLNSSTQGECYLPVTSAYCTGYDPNTVGTQTVTISVLGVTATFELTVQSGHVHTEEVIPGKEATCTDTGLTAGRKCSGCGQVLVAQTVIPALGHTEQILPKKDATCAEQGLTEGKICATCRVILDPQEIIWPLGHVQESIPGRAATCTESGLTEGVKCSRCSMIFAAQEAILPLGHNEKVLPGKEATCTELGLTEGKQCTVCGVVTVEQKPVQSRGHIEEVLPAKAATCTGTGLTEGRKCSDCGEVVVAQEVVPALGHTEEIIPGKAADCTASGLTEGKKCTVCGETTLAQETIAPKGHEFSGDVCTVCGSLRMGDFNGDKTVDSADAECLLWHILFGDPIQGDGDVNKDGKVDEADAIYLIWHTLFPELYPL